MSFNKLKQNLGKSNLLIKELLDTFKSDPKNLEEDPEEEEPEEEEAEEESGSDSKSESGSDSDSDSDVKLIFLNKKDSESKSGDSESGSGDESDSGSEESEKWDSDGGEEEDTEIDMDKRKELAREERRKFWLKKEVPKDKAVDLKAKKNVVKKAPGAEKDRNYEVVQFEEFEAIELIPSVIEKKMTEIATQRAQLDVNDIAKAIKTLEYILEHEEKEQNEIKQLDLIIILVNLRNELNQNAYMDREMWISSSTNLQNFLTILMKHKADLEGKVTNYL